MEFAEGVETRNRSERNSGRKFETVILKSFYPEKIQLTLCSIIYFSVSRKPQLKKFAYQYLAGNSKGTRS